MPALSVLLSWQRALLVHSTKTAPITWASGLEIIGVVIGLFAGIVIFDWIGAIAAAAGLMLGRLDANTWLYFSAGD